MDPRSAPAMLWGRAGICAGAQLLWHQAGPHPAPPSAQLLLQPQSWAVRQHLAKHCFGIIGPQRWIGVRCPLQCCLFGVLPLFFSSWAPCYGDHLGSVGVWDEVWAPPHPLSPPRGSNLGFSPGVHHQSMDPWSDGRTQHPSPVPGAEQEPGAWWGHCHTGRQMPAAGTGEVPSPPPSVPNWYGMSYQDTVLDCHTRMLCWDAMLECHIGMQYWDAILGCTTRMLFSWDAVLGCSIGMLYWDSVLGCNSGISY